METPTSTPTPTPTTEATQNNENIPTYVTYLNYTNNRLSCTPSEQKTIPGTGPGANPPSPPQCYYIIPLMFNFGSQDNRILADFYFEGCEMESSFGIQSKPGQSGRLEHSVMCRFDANNGEHAKFIESMGQVHAGCAYILHTMKGTVKLYNFNKDMAEATGLKNPVYRARDEVTGDVIQGRAPSMFFKLFSRGKPPLIEQTLFTGLDGKPIPWTLMQNVEMKFIPLIHIKRMYVGGGKASIQMEVVSAIVTSIRARNTTTRQISTIHKLQQSRPELADTVSAQLAKLTIDRQDQMLNTVPNTDQHPTDSQPTFAGIEPTGQRQMLNHTHSGTLPAIPSQGMQPTMQDFTAAAPLRQPVIPATFIPGESQKTPPTGHGAILFN